VRTLRKIVKGGDLSSNLFQVNGGGRKSKLKDVENEITKKIEANNYHSQQEIADMVKSEYGIAIHRSGISRLLKKNALKD
jgi:transposase